jgi:hypothetical protein
MYSFHHLTYKNDFVVLALILVVILTFVKVILYYSSLTKIHSIIISDEKFEKFRHKISDIVDISFIIISLIILFFRKNNSITIIIIALLLLIKAAFHFIVYYKLYKYINLEQKHIDHIIIIHKYESFLTNTLLFIISFYMLKIIFSDK